MEGDHMANACKTCGGSVQRVKNHYVCDFCGNKWEIDSSDDVHAVDRANAWRALRDGDFQKAAESFEGIIAKEPEDHEAHWGRALAQMGIVYVTDLNENKKVPTCNNITERSFRDDTDVCKAIALAPDDIADSYRVQAVYIDRVRLEWLEKASRGPAYDIFISYKDSDRENGIARTRDSVDAQDLYNALTAEGYKVFFSRVSLRDKISEQFEPYIYNAIRTAKVMIVFGEKAEYFGSAWIRNEWSRFKARIEAGEKHRNSLVVVYKDMDPHELPVVLKARQCMDAGDMTFLSDLLRHIRRVVDESKKTVRLEKIQISQGQIAKKASALSVNTVRTREIGSGAFAETGLSAHQSLSLICSYLSASRWNEALKLVDDVLFDDPNCAEAMWYSLLAKHHVSSSPAIVPLLQDLTDQDFAYVEKVLNFASRRFAEELLLLLYASGDRISSDTYCKVLNVILPFSFDKRRAQIESAFDGVIRRDHYRPFRLLLSTLDPSAVDAYIRYNVRFLESTNSAQARRACIRSILDVDEGNTDALRHLLFEDLYSADSADELIEDLETLLRYAPDADAEVADCLDWLGEELATDVHCAFARQLIRYYTGELSGLEKKLVRLSERMIGMKFPEDAEYLLNLILSFENGDPDVYWAICMIRAGVSTERGFLEKDILLRDIPEFNKYLTLLDEEKRRRYIDLSAKQMNERKKRLAAEADDVETDIMAEEILLKDMKKIPPRRRKCALLLPLFLMSAYYFYCRFWGALHWGDVSAPVLSSVLPGFPVEVTDHMALLSALPGALLILIGALLLLERKRTRILFFILFPLSWALISALADMIFYDLLVSAGMTYGLFLLVLLIGLIIVLAGDLRIRSGDIARREQRIKALQEEYDQLQDEMASL